MVTIPKYKHIPDEQVRTKSDRRAIDEGMTFDVARGKIVVDFCEKYIYPTRGMSANQQIKLMDWQSAALLRWGSWVRLDGSRRFRKGCLFCSRQQGKSFFGVCLSAYMWLRDGEPGSYVICTAVARQQVQNVWFNELYNSYEHWTPQHRAEIDASKSQLKMYYRKGNATLQGLSNEGWSKLGTPPHYAQLEELAFWGDYNPLTAIETGIKSRRQPFILAVSTSGTDRTTPAYDWWQHGLAVLDDGVVDTDFFPLIFAADIKDNIHEPSTWRKAAPSLGVTVPEDEYRKESEAAKRSKIAELKMRQFSLNQWVSSTNQFLNLDAWQKCIVTDWPNLDGKDCWIGIDQSSSGGDLTAVVWIVQHEGRIYVRHHAWVSRAGVVRVDQSQNLTKYSAWETQDWMTIHEGNTVDYEDMRSFVRNLASKYNVRGIALDPSHNANDTFLALQADGLPVEPYWTSAKNMNEPMRRLSDMVDNHVIAHQGDDLINWQAQNLEGKKNSMDMLMPHKPGESYKIDTFLALLYALAIYIRGTAEPYQEESIYNTMKPFMV